MPSTARTSIRRAALATGTAALTAPMLAGCFLIPGDGGAQPVEFDGVQPATIQLEAQGTFIEQGTLDPSETLGRGSGFFISPDGVAVTNNHVVTGAGTLKIYIGGDAGTAYSATVLSASECLDLAVVKVDVPDPVPFYGWYEGDITVGLEVYSVGFPLGEPQFTMTKGIVSKIDASGSSSWASLPSVLEHDARIRGGNSGGPLIAPNGRVVGVNYAGYDELDYNWAIDRDDAVANIDKLRAGERVLSLGLNLKANAPSETGAPQGIWVTSVDAGGPADLAGIEPGDIIDSLAGVTMGANGTIDDYCEVLRTQGVDQTMDVTVWRPATDETLEGQVNGTPLEVVTSGSGNGGTPPEQPTVGAFVDVIDDSASLTVQVPDTWTQVDGSPYTDAVGNVWSTITASPDIAGFQGGFEVPGITIAAAAGTPLAPADILGEFDGQIASICEPDTQAGDYADGYATGLYSYWVDCGGTGSDIAIVAATLDDGSAVMWFTLQMVDDFDKSSVLETVLQSYVVAF
jgi:serine protease Do